MTLTVRPADPRSGEGRALLGQSHALLSSLYPPEHNHYLSVDELAQPHIDFWIAAAGDQPLGCIALARLGDYGEVKSMFVAPAARGQGVGAALLATLEDHARAHALPVLRLETGDDLFPAHRLYRRHGFADCGPFGDYEPGPHSVFMEKRL
ncbi:GNAT family N-acetyltransferase [Rubellimicrobium aerolatum]|uniref:GNAT family N-acetyltransferase n=1 Tax=Rubellimicrobium aerolatum TaxID=490979 RepID=A0ABW0SCK2_9RHOB|nr:GNAT family N-acetyltransferase [Rubellimicrobium aerolatum]MBP1806147.1 putative acetyltransferase [Rubellimicrobium aerolatum]